MTHINIEGNEIFFIAPSDPTVPAPNVHVVDFVGTEGLSKLYQYELTLATQSQVDLDVAINIQAVFYARANRDLFFIHGIISNIKELREVDGYYFYKATLVPKMWELTQTKRSEIYQNKSIPQIIEQILNDSGFTSPDDYEILLSDRTLPAGADPNNYDSNFYRKWDYVCQHQETNFNFISRWMEREGIYYFFEQYQDKTKIIFTDSKGIHIELPANLLTTPSTTYRDALLTPLPTAPGPYYLMDYSPPSGLESTVSTLCVSSMVCTKKQLPNQVVLQDYNYRQTSPVIVGSSNIDMPVISPSALPSTTPPTVPTITPGTTAVTSREVHLYGEHVKDIDEANLYASIRAEEISCRGIVFNGESTIPYLRPGYVYNLKNHFKIILNSDETNYPATPLYLITEVRHEGSQAPLIFGGTNVPLPPEETKGYYRNTFETIQDHVQFRPEKTTPKPKFYGTINAKVVGDGMGGLYAERNLEGQYKVKLPFDRSENEGQRASRWVRMQQPYAGQNYGADFPMLPDTEVLLTFIDGDPDRPIISGGVYNPTSDIASAMAAASVAQAAANAAQTSADGVTGSIVADLGDSNQSALDTALNSRIQQQINSISSITTAGGNKLTMDDTLNAKRIRLRSPGSLWFEARGRKDELATDDHVTNNAGGRYGNYIVGAPPKADVPVDLQYLHDKFFAADGGFRPKNNQLYAYTSPGTAIATLVSGFNAAAPTTKPDPEDATKTVPTTVAERAAWINNNQWNKMLEHGQVKIVKGDTFKTQEGNIYDFGGYWNYNLGNSYAENHIHQDHRAELNKTRSRDLLNVGGPGWSSMSGNSISDKGDWSAVRVEKSFGNEYSYTEAHSISVNNGGSSFDVQYGGKHVEKKYRGDQVSGSDRLLYKSEADRGISEEWVYDFGTGHKVGHSKNNRREETGASTHEESTYSRSWADTLVTHHDETRVGLTVNTYDFSWASKASASLNFGAYAAFSLDLSAKAEFAVAIGGGIQFSFAGSLKILIDTGLAANLKLKAHGGGDHCYDAVSGKWTSDLPFTEVHKKAEVKADMESLVLHRLMIRMGQEDLDFMERKLKFSKKSAGIENADIRLFT